MGADTDDLGGWAGDGCDAAGHRAVSVVELVREEAASPAGSCLHCHLPMGAARQFCCPGCAAAYETIQALGLGRYYAQRVLDPALRAPRPELAEARDVTRHVATRADGSHELTLAVDGLQCGACVWLIESVLAREPDVLEGRVNLTTRRLRLVWRGLAARANSFVEAIEGLGYRLVPFSAEALAAAQDSTGRALLRALAVAGFAAGNVMLLSIGVWAGAEHATRDLLHWVSALIAMPAIAYAGRPFFLSAWVVLRRGRTNMDVPISLGVVLVTGMSLIQTIRGSEDAYFDSACALLFFLLIGRLLDHRARGQARATAEQLLMLRTADVAVVRDDGHVERRGQESVATGDRVLVGMGERIGVDGVVERGASLLDTSLVTGESLPAPVTPGAAVFAGTLNLGEALTVRSTATGGGTLLAECVRLIEAAEARRSRFVVLADRVARRYAPAVHVTALATFLWWYFVAGVPAGTALLTASAVLIVTCPCALALAVPVVQVIATGRLFRSGLLLKSPTALERLADVDTVVFDKTGTLTEPVLALERGVGFDEAALQVAASLAVASRHPLARSLVAAAGPVAMAEGAAEVPGQGVRARDVKLGSRSFVVTDDRVKPEDGRDEREGPEMWLARPGVAPVRFGFVETLREDAAATVARLRAMGVEVHLLSGDRASAVASVAQAIGIGTWQAERTPAQKVAAIEALMSAGRKVLMVGDGLNDGPSLAAATVSASPATAADVSQTVADVVFQGSRLAPVAAVIETARRARGVMRQNLALSIGYNVLMVPLAVAGFVTPWLAAAAMSSSSLAVMLNSFRLRGGSI
ncbi:MAG TPA: heavy metal translocating P-type ATPase metal-binding domain-containing protein [Acetobacteraceae bacterium]|nr:heavy metal translocating P-type ATPase metal-binding domain-containing protein [Acetobacteraceae bacterium]